MSGKKDSEQKVGIDVIFKNFPRFYKAAASGPTDLRTASIQLFTSKKSNGNLFEVHLSSELSSI